MKYAFVAYPAAPIRRKAKHSSEMTSQLLFGESVQILKSKGDLWVKVRSLHDSYEGWVTNTLLQEATEKDALSMIKYVTTDLLSVINIGDRKLHVPAGSSLPLFELSQDGQPGGKGKLGNLEYTFAGNLLKRDEQKPEQSLLTQLSTAWLNAPYLWGGRTPLGVDCSGFVQVIYKQMGIDLPRDAWQQAQEGESVEKFANSQAGDLVFFNNKEDIVHVGILLGDGTMIHSSGKVKIDAINKKGVIDAATGKKVLSLRAIRRVW
jgi:gamma-D-glutamyl-L-lysine dipeptidyl-peptidase